MKLELNAAEASAVRDALIDAAIALRTNRQTEVVMSEKAFFAADISEGRRRRYLLLMGIADKLDDRYEPRRAG